jgi:16S rRNA pseudouridine516 synthase
MRLDKYLHQSAGLSRSRAKKLVRDRHVAVDHEVVTDAGYHVPHTAAVTLDGAPLSCPAVRYFMLNKPSGMICATRDPEQRTVIDLFAPGDGDDLIIAGRLDIDTTGLLLLSEDGRWVHRITSPRHRKPKVYHAMLAAPLADDAEKHFERGVFLKGENKRTLPALLERLGPTDARVTVVEGRYHQVKRMFAALGNRVTALHRERIGDLELDPDLAPGEYRRLSEKEKQGFMS